MLTGTYYRLLDTKGRVVISSPISSELGEEFVLTRAPGGCLMALSEREWRRMVRKKQREEWFQDLVISGAFTLRRDETTGRVLIPESLRDYAGLQPHDSVVVAGMGRMALVCSKARWDSHLQKVEETLLSRLKLVEGEASAAPA